MTAVLPENMKVLLIYFDERRCRQWLIEELHPEGVKCPHCGEIQRSSHMIGLAYSLKRVICEGCKRKFSLFSGTIFEGTRLTARQLVTMLMCFRFRRGDQEISRMAKTSRTTVFRWRMFLQAAGSKIV
jgi:transposase-like protein